MEFVEQAIATAQADAAAERSRRSSPDRARAPACLASRSAAPAEHQAKLKALKAERSSSKRRRRRRAPPPPPSTTTAGAARTRATRGRATDVRAVRRPRTHKRGAWRFMRRAATGRRARRHRAEELARAVLASSSLDAARDARALLLRARAPGAPRADGGGRRGERRGERRARGARARGGAARRDGSVVCYLGPTNSGKTGGARPRARGAGCARARCACSRWSLRSCARARAGAVGLWTGEDRIDGARPSCAARPSARGSRATRPCRRVSRAPTGAGRDDGRTTGGRS